MNLYGYSLFTTLPKEILLKIGYELNFLALKQLKSSGKEGQFLVNYILDTLAKELLLSKKTREEQKVEFRKYHFKLAPYFIKSIYQDIDQLKNKVFENGILVVDYTKYSYTPFFLAQMACPMLDQLVGYEEIANDYQKLTKKGDRFLTVPMLQYYYQPNEINPKEGLDIIKRDSNSIEDAMNPKFLKALKEVSKLFFKQLYSLIQIIDCTNKSTLPTPLNLKKYQNRYALVIYAKDTSLLNFQNYCIIITHIAKEANLLKKIEIINYPDVTAFYGEKKEIQKLAVILQAQQSSKNSISIKQLRYAEGLTSS